jgi:hypothetical protein
MVDFHSAGPARIIVNIHIHVAAPQPGSNSLPNARFEYFKTVRHPQVKVQEPMVHASQVDPHGTPVAFHAGLREPGH